MIGLGTIVNCAAVIVGCTVGLFIKKGVAPRFEDMIKKALGLSTTFIGLSGALVGLLKITETGKIETRGTMLMIFSLVIGAILGEALRIEDRLDSIGEKLKRLLKVKDSGSRFVEGFVTNTLVICVGAMAIVGSLNDGISGDASTLYAKSVLDCVIGVIFASTLGIGALFAVIPMAIYQGGITLCAKFIEPYLTDAMISDMSYVGSILIFCIGINLAFGKKFKTGNLLPAILVPIVYNIIVDVM